MRQCRKKFFILPLLFSLFYLHSHPGRPVIVNNTALKGEYIGKHIAYLNEGDLFLELSRDWQINDRFKKKLLSGQLRSDREIQLIFKDYPGGYQVKLSNGQAEAEIVWGIEDLQKIESRLPFKKSEKEIFNLNFNPHAYWLRFSIFNQSNQIIECYIEQDKHLYNDFDLFIPRAQDLIIKRSSFNQPLSKNELNYKNTVFQIDVQPGLNTYYIRTDSNFIDPIPLRLWDKQHLLKNAYTSNLLQGIIIGFFLLIIGYSFFIYLSSRNITYLYLSLMALFILISHLGVTGFGFQHLWPNHSHWSTLAIFMSFPLIFIFNLSFCRNFIDIPEYTPIIDLIIRIMIYTFLAILIVMLIVALPIKKKIFALLVVIDSVYCLPAALAAVIIFQKGNRSSLFLLIGIALYIFSQLEFILSRINIIPYQLINVLNIRGLSFTIIMTWGIRDKFIGMKKSFAKLNQLKMELVQENLKLKGTRKNITDEAKIKIEAVKNYIKKNYWEVITRDSLSYAVGYSPDHLGRVFKQFTGQKISDYLNQIRIEQACQKLSRTNQQVIDIAFETGFESLRTFNKVFLNIMNCTPSQYRNKKSKP